jgi:hypothetical protein
MLFKALFKPQAIAASNRQQRCRGVTKMLRIMKLTAILMTVLALHVGAKGLSQTINFSGKDVPLQKIFSVIEQQTGYVVFYVLIC